MQKRFGDHVTPESQIDVSISIVTYKSRAFIGRALDSLLRDRPQVAHEIFVVDNGSDDGTVAYVRQRYTAELSAGRLTVIENQQNLGFSRANNQAIERARGRYVLLLNPDTEITRGAIDALVKKADELSSVAGAPQSRLGALAPRLAYPDGRYQANFYGFPGAITQVRKLLFLEKRQEARVRRGDLVAVDCAWGAALLFEREMDGELTLLDKNIFLYSEDLELCWRLAARGRQTYVYGGATVIHAHNKSGEQHFAGAGAGRANLARLVEFKKTLRYVTRKYWRGPFTDLRFWIYCQLEALNAQWRRLLLAVIMRVQKSHLSTALGTADYQNRQAEHAATARVFSGITASHPPLTRAERTITIVALALFVSLAVTIAVLLPRGRGNDEDSHVTYSRYVADYGQLPDPLNMDFGTNREPHQPPLFYGLSAAWLTATRPLGLGIDGLRLGMILLGLIQFDLIRRIGRLVLPIGWRTVPLLLFAAVPMLAHQFSTVNNDALSFVFVSVVTLAMVHLWRPNAHAGWYAVAALAGSAAVLTKLFAGPPVLILGLAITLVARRTNKMRVWLTSLLVAAIPLVLWMWWNYHTTGLFIPELHLGSLPELAPYREDVTWNYAASFFVVLWQSLIGRLGSWDISYPDLLYVAYLIPVGLGLAGLGRSDHGERDQAPSAMMRRLSYWVGAAFAAELIPLAYLNRDFFQPQSRYLYPIMAGLMVVITIGLRRTLSLRSAAALLVILGAISLALTPGLM